MKKASTLVLSFLLCAGLCMPAVAEETEGTSPEVSTTPETSEVTETPSTQTTETNLPSLEEEPSEVEVPTQQQALPNAVTEVEVPNNGLTLLSTPTNEGEGTPTVDDGINTLDELVKAISDSSTDTIQLSGSINIDKSIDLDLKGKTLIGANSTRNGDSTDNMLNILAEGVTIANGHIVAGSNTRNCIANVGYANLNLKGLEINHSEAYAGAPLILNGSNGSSSATLNEVRFVLGNNSWYAINLDSTKNPITLNADALNVTGANKNAVVGEKSSDVTVTVAGENYFPLQDDKEGSNFVIGHAEAKVGDEYYGSIEKAITLSSAGATVEVLSDAEIEGPIEINHNLTLKGNGKSITAKYEGGTGNKSILTALAGTEVTIENIALNDSPKYGVQAYNQSKVRLNGVTINNASYGGVLANGGDCDITNVVVNGDSPAIELAYGDKVTKVSNVTIKGLTGNNNGIYVDKSQFDSKVGVDETNQLIERLTTVATNNGFNLYTDSGVVVVNDDAVENKVNNPAETLAVNKEWKAFNDTEEAAKAGDAKLGYNTLILKESTKGGYVSYQYNGHPLNENGTAVSFKLYLDPAAYKQGESFTPSIALNGQDGKYCVEYGIIIQRDGDGFNFNGNHYAVEKDDVYTVTVSFAKKGDLLVVKGTVTNESGQVVYEEYLTDNSHPDAMGNATSVRYVWIHSNEQVADVYVNNPEVILCTDKVQTPTEEESKSETSNVVTTWDDGGPFTTDANGNVFDRWGNEIWHNPVQSTTGTTGGFQLVNTSDR